MPLKDPEARKAYRKAHYAANKERILAANAAWKASNPDKAAASVRAWHEANPERVAEIKRASAERRPRQREVTPERKAYHAEWRRAHPEKLRQHLQNSRAKRALRVPPWFGELDELVIAEAHDLCHRLKGVTGQPWHVDHDIPLRGKLVSGLHVWNNINVLPGVENIRKGNRFTPGA